MAEIIGITGNICSGKTAVLQFFEEKGQQILKTDRFLYDTYKNPQCKQEILAVLDESVLDFSGEIDRLLLKKRLLKDPHLTKELWEITDQYLDPVVIEALKNHQDGRLFFETAQLFEKNWDRYCRKTIVCYAPDDKRALWLQERAKKRDGLDLKLGEAYEVLRQQMTQEEKVRKADLVIYNLGTIEDLHAQCHSILTLLGGIP